MTKKGIIFYTTLFLLILTFSMTASHFDFDLWARLIAGMGVIDGGHVLKTDFLSYTPTHTWWDHEWGASVVFYAFYKYFGAYSLIVLQSLMFFGIFFTASRIVKMRTNHNPYNILYYIFAVIIAMDTLNSPIRCHMFSFLFFTIFIYLLEKVRLGNKKLLFLIPVIIVFWNNIHGGVVAGIGLLCMYALGEFLNKKPFMQYIYTLIASCAALFINPWGYDYIKFLLMANTMPRTFIVEWRSIFNTINLTDFIKFKIYAPIILGIEAVYLIKDIKSKTKNWYNELDKTKYIVVLATTYLACSHIKLIPFFIISAVCFMYEDFYEITKNIKFPVWKDKFIYGFIIFLCVFTLVSKEYTLPVGMDKYPVKEIEFVKINKLKGNILTNFGYGSYAAYKLYPNNLIYMDGRYEEVYPDYAIKLMKEFFMASKVWEQLITYFPPDIIILEKTYPIYNFPEFRKDWKIVYEGNMFGVFLPYKKSNKNFIQPSNDINYYKNNLFSTDIKF